MRSTNSKRFGGFTLIELLVVVLILSLVSATVVLRSSGIQRQAVSAAAVTRLELLDQHMRHFARSRGRPCTLELDPEQGRFRKVYDLDANKGPGWESLGLDLAEVRTGEEKASHKRANVTFDPSGMSSTYGLRLEGAGSQGGWLVFAGVSGQMIRLDSEQDSNAAFALLAPPKL